MPRRSILSAAERESLLALPDTKDELIRHYTFSESDLSIIRQRRGPANRLGFAVQLCYLRFPGVILGADEPPFPPLLRLVANQLKVGIESWDEYGQREQTRREHLVELQTVFGFQPFTIGHYRQAVQLLTELAMQTDKGIVLARALIEHLRRQSVIVPALNAVERASAEAITRANRRLFGRIGQALIEAKQAGRDPFAAIEAVMSWDAFAESVTEAQRLAQPEDFDFLHRIGESYATLRRYAPEFLDVLKLRAAPAAKDVLDAIEVLRSMNSDNARKVPTDAPTEFIKPRWQKLVMTDTGIDRRYYELCALSELKNALRSGDIWVQGSRQFKDFEDYLVPPAKFASLKQASELPLAVATDCDQYLHDRLTLLETQLATVNRMALANELPDAIITESGLKITPLDAAVPDTAQALIDQTAMILPHVKITELLLEVDEWTGFTRHFAHLKSGDLAKDKNLLLTTILADAINLGLTKMAESCPGTTYAKLAWLQAWHIRDETYGAALAELVNAQFRHPFAEHWGDGTTSSSDGQNFRTGSKAESTGHINPKYGSSPGRTFYTHISDQYAPFHTKVVNVGVRDSTYVLDGLLYHESDLRIEEHYTDTAGFTDHVFALMHLLGFRFAPRIRDLGDTKLYIPKGDATYEALKPMIGGTLNIKHVRAHWDEILRMATSIKQGTATASLMLRKLGSYPRQNGLAVALRELGRIERTLFILDWLQSVELRRRVHAGLNKGEARNALARAVFFNRLGEIRDRSFEQQRYRASGLNLVTAAIVLWNTVYLERAANALRGHGQAVDDGLLQYLSPLGWEHINLTGDYLWRSSAKIGAGKFRPLRPLQPA
ncbi:Tn3 family transposase [Rivihabitans pingtungensis]|uniref:TnpA family transposase n=1 Tax=Rivihabitans pingtungensis TaxID=1054498 RepID=A0A318KIG5_9NEIS|nr:Tn3 family transposase [Rivihabitans pingtungensis]PXX75867.1 TnpA family transposase [Rivihabitans pingtungensis]